MSTLNLWNYLSLVSAGSEKSAKQGDAADAPQTPLSITVDGACLDDTGVLATATVRTVYDDSAQFPAAFKYLFYVSDQDSYVQLIFAGTNVILPVLASVPFVLGPLGDNLDGLAAANTSLISGGSEPTLTDLDKVVVGNYSGSDMNYRFLLID